jgi:hypothetical protein
VLTQKRSLSDATELLIGRARRLTTTRNHSGDLRRQISGSAMQAARTTFTATGWPRSGLA